MRYFAITTSLMFLAAIATIVASCRLDDGFSPPQLRRVTLLNTETYTYETGISGDEEGASIVRQAEHYTRSEIVRDASTGWQAVYVYEPAEGYTGEDYVELKTSRGSDGESPPTKVEIIRIQFTVK